MTNMPAENISQEPNFVEESQEASEDQLGGATCQSDMDVKVWWTLYLCTFRSTQQAQFQQKTPIAANQYDGVSKHGAFNEHNG